MKRVVHCLISCLLLLSCCMSNVYASSKSTIVRYSVSANVVYEDYDGSKTTQKVTVGSYLKEPKPLGKKNAKFLGWVDSETNDYWDFNQPVMKHLHLTARYTSYKSIENAKVLLDNAIIYNGKIQTQRIRKVLLDGKEIPLEDLEIINNQGSQVGTYSMLIKAKENSGYVGSLSWCWVIVPSKDYHISNVDDAIDIGKGHFSIEVVLNDYINNVDITTSSVELLNIFIENGIIDADDLTSMANGDSIKFVLEIKDGSSVMSNESKTAIESGCQDYYIARYFDINLYEHIYRDGRLQLSKQISQTGSQIDITIQLEDRFINKDSMMKRTFCVVRNHEGKVDFLDTKYDAKEKTITFSTNLFSDYAIVYKDEKLKKPANSKLPFTGDYHHIFIFVVGMLMSFMAFYKIKKQ